MLVIFSPSSIRSIEQQQSLSDVSYTIVLVVIILYRLSRILTTDPGGLGALS